MLLMVKVFLFVFGLTVNSIFPGTYGLSARRSSEAARLRAYARNGRALPAPCALALGEPPLASGAGLIKNYIL